MRNIYTYSNGKKWSYAYKNGNKINFLYNGSGKFYERLPDFTGTLTYVNVTAGTNDTRSVDLPNLQSGMTRYIFVIAQWASINNITSFTIAGSTPTFGSTSTNQVRNTWGVLKSNRTGSTTIAVNRSSSNQMVISCWVFDTPFDNLVPAARVNYAWPPNIVVCGMSMDMFGRSCTLSNLTQNFYSTSSTLVYIGGSGIFLEGGAEFGVSGATNQQSIILQLP